MGETDVTEPASAAEARSARGGRFLREWLPRAALESFLIVVSLLAALALNQWNEDRQTAKRVAEARGFLIEEVRANRRHVAADAIFPHHVRLARGLNTYRRIANPTRADLDLVFAGFETGVHPASFKDAVWRSVMASDLLRHMDQREVFMLADIYRRQEELADMNRAFFPTLVAADPESRDPETLRRLVQTLGLYLGDVTSTEGELLERYDTALKALGEPPEPKVVLPRD